MRQKHAVRLTAITNAVVISVEDLAKGNLKGSRYRTIDRVYHHSADGSLTGTSFSKDNKKVHVKYRKSLNCWVH